MQKASDAMTKLDPRLVEIARQNVEANLSDATTEDGEDSIFDSAFTLGFDALVDAGVDHKTAGYIAHYVAMSYANP